MYLADLTSPQVRRILESSRKPVLLLPVDATEPHGPHAPLGTDPIISAGVCQRCAERLADDPEVRVLLLPPISYGVTEYAAAFSGAIGISPRTLHSLVVEVCACLARQGLHRIVLVNNHFEPEHVATVKRAAVTARTEHGALVGHLDLTRRRNARRLTAEFQAGQCHAGQYETSLVLAEHPELVDAEAQRDLPAVSVDIPAAVAEGHTDFHAMGMAAAYCGAPAAASAEEGESTFDALASMLVETVRELGDER